MVDIESEAKKTLIILCHHVMHIILLCKKESPEKNKKRMCAQAHITYPTQSRLASKTAPSSPTSASAASNPGVAAVSSSTM